MAWCGTALLPRVKSPTPAIALIVVAIAPAACRDSRISPEHPSQSTPQSANVTQTAAVRPALATPNTSTGAIEIVIPDRPSHCGPLQEFPRSCEKAWRVRIELAPEYQRPAKYQLGPELLPWSYRDAQGKSGGAWGEGTDCKNLGDHLAGSLEIVALDADGITGALSGAGEADGPFRAQRCPSCNGTGMECTSNSECCNDFCYAGKCQP